MYLNHWYWTSKYILNETQFVKADSPEELWTNGNFVNWITLQVLVGVCYSKVKNAVNYFVDNHFNNLLIFLCQVLYISTVFHFYKAISDFYNSVCEIIACCHKFIFGLWFLVDFLCINFKLIWTLADSKDSGKIWGQDCWKWVLWK